MYKIIIRGLLGVLKLPVALLAVFILPPLALRTYSAALESFDGENWIFWVSVGLAFLLGWTVVLRWSVTRFLLILEHEMIHVLLAWLTGLKVERLEVNHKQDGGLAMIEAPANWLVALGPYFVPLALFLYAFVVHALPVGAEGLEIAMGAILGYELAANMRELHPRQTDFGAAGWWFTCMFLPSAILLMYGGAFHYALTGDLLGGWTYIWNAALGSFAQSWDFVVTYMA